MSYSDELRYSNEWKELRKRIFSERHYLCEDCGLKRPVLHLHHKYYESPRQPHDYPDDCFKVLCDECHSLTTEALRSLQYCLGRFTGNQIADLEIALTESIIVHCHGKAGPVHNWLMACLSDISKAHLSFAPQDEGLPNL